MRKHKHLNRFHTKGHSEPNKPSLSRRPHGLLSHVKPLTPKQAARVAKRIALGVYANASATRTPAVGG